MTALYFGWPAFRNRHFFIWGGGGLAGGGIIFIPGGWSKMWDMEHIAHQIPAVSAQCTLVNKT